MNEDLKRQLVAELGPVTPLKNSVRQNLRWLLVLELAFVVVGVALLHLREKLSGGYAAWELPLLALIAYLAARAALQSLTPGRPVSRVLVGGVTGSLALWMLASFGVMGAHVVGGRWNPSDAGTGGLQCSLKMTVVAVIFALGLWIVMRRGASTRPGQSAYWGALAAFALAAFWQRIACPSDSSVHLVVYHLLPIVPLVALGRAALRYSTRW